MNFKTIYIYTGYEFWSSKACEGGYHVTAYAFRCSFGPLTFTNQKKEFDHVTSCCSNINF